MTKWTSFQITNIVLLSVITALIVWVVLIKPMFARNYYGQMHFTNTKTARDLQTMFTQEDLRRQPADRAQRIASGITTKTRLTPEQRAAAMNDIVTAVQHGPQLPVHQGPHLTHTEAAYALATLPH